MPRTERQSPGGGGECFTIAIVEMPAPPIFTIASVERPGIGFSTMTLTMPRLIFMPIANPTTRRLGHASELNLDNKGTGNRASLGHSKRSQVTRTRQSTTSIPGSSELSHLPRPEELLTESNRNITNRHDSTQIFECVNNAGGPVPTETRKPNSTGRF